MSKQLTGGRQQRCHDGSAKSSDGAERIVNGRCFIAAMDHAVGAFLVPAGPVVIPVRVIDELLEGRGVAVLEEVTRLLPAEDIVGGIAPRRALVIHFTHEEVQKEWRLV